MPRFFIMCILVLLVAVPAVGAQQQGCVNQVTVWDGDSLYGIAQRYNVNAVELAQANGLVPNARLLIGQVLCLDGLAVAQPSTGTTPATGTTPTTGTTPSTGTTSTTGTGGPTTGTPPTTGTVTGTTPTRVLGFVRGQGNTLPTGWQEYVVAVEDNLYKISQKFTVSLLEIAQANNITNVNIVFLGESLRIPPGTGGTGNTNGNTGNAVWNLPNGPNTIPLISIQPNVAKPGSNVNVVGSNYPPNSTVTLYLEKKAFYLKSDVLATVKADANGQFQHQVTIPATWPGGAAIDQPTVSISGYTAQGGFWAMNYFVNQ
ncbi:MAG: LysM peptidoglycan-binding domain-containing protein [Anaerolineae bacterium]|nr:LysM peptidoglycan-binding domain-containing protein [Anaerolineae bacterium]